MRALPVGFERLPPVAETKERRSWAAACLGASEAKREGLAATRKSKRAKRSGSGPQGSAASGGGKRPKRLGRHLRLRKHRAAQMLSVNPNEIL